MSRFMSEYPASGIPYPVSGPRPFIIPVFLPNAGCPHRCVFCDQGDVTGIHQPVCATQSLRRTVSRFLSHRDPNRKPAQISFYGGNFLGLKQDDIHRLLAEAEAFVSSHRVDSIRFSTRPDTVTEERLNMIKRYPVSTIEIGVQSMDDRVLARSQRGHTAADTAQAVHRLKAHGYEIGLQMMVGLPGDNDAGAMATGRKIVALAPDFVRIYPTVVLKHSRLAQWYQNGDYVPLPLDRCVTLVKKLYLLFTENRIPVIRMGLQPSDDLASGICRVAGPFHPAFGHLVHSEIFLDMAESLLKSECNLPETVFIRVHPRSISKLRGLKNGNISILKKKFHLNAIRIIPDVSLAEDRLLFSQGMQSCPAVRSG